MTQEPAKEWDLEEIFGITEPRSVAFSIEIIPTGTPDRINYLITNLGTDQLEPEAVVDVLRAVIDGIERQTAAQARYLRERDS